MLNAGTDPSPPAPINQLGMQANLLLDGEQGIKVVWQRMRAVDTGSARPRPLRHQLPYTQRVTVGGGEGGWGAGK